MSETLAPPADANARYAPKIPAAVRKIAADAEALQAATYNPQPAPAPAPSPAPAPAAPSNTTVVTAPTTVGNPPASSTPAPTPAPQQDWEQKFRSLEGRFNVQAQELRTARESAAHIATLQGQVADLTQKLNAATRQPAPQQQQATLDPKDIETWGEDLLGAARRSARAELQPEVEDLRRQVAQLSAQSQNNTLRVQQTTLEANRRNVDGMLASMVGPDWNDTNNDPGFIAWLNERDFISGQVRMPLLHQAYNSGDAQRVAVFFNTWRAQHTVQNPSVETPAHTPTPGAGTIPLETFAAPGAGRSAPTSNGAAPTPVYVTQKEIAQFYSDVTKGKFRHNPQGYARREAEINAAVREGRVTI
jgi:polyhydroxyalkanoate synthesis regulator phasin